ncbi:MAG: hypothetical protein LBE81_09535 [Azonexus sp.]|uniref:hypothetical protein n=1 Tax=Azonexus sp. TaxID=1872668 RepID=UPI002820F8B7|nr:hypothetical protein [Azonexus sp.]MDR0776862.1 hypothetical protein [Azonexus sp.]
MNIVAVGIDLAKNIFALHGVGQGRQAVLVKPFIDQGFRDGHTMTTTQMQNRATKRQRRGPIAHGRDPDT